MFSSGIRGAYNLLLNCLSKTAEKRGIEGKQQHIKADSYFLSILSDILCLIQQVLNMSAWSVYLCLICLAHRISASQCFCSQRVRLFLSPPSTCGLRVNGSFVLKKRNHDPVETKRAASKCPSEARENCSGIPVYMLIQSLSGVYLHLPSESPLELTYIYICLSLKVGGM